MTRVSATRAPVGSPFASSGTSPAGVDAHRKSCGIPVGEPCARVERDLAMRQARVEVEQDDQAVVDPGSPDAPLVHERRSLGLGSSGVMSSRPSAWCVDDDLDLRLRLDGVDDLLRLRDRPGLQHIRVVVDRLPVCRFRERWAGRTAGVGPDGGRSRRSWRGAGGARRPARQRRRRATRPMTASGARARVMPSSESSRSTIRPVARA